MLVKKRYLILLDTWKRSYKNGQKESQKSFIIKDRGGTKFLCENLSNAFFCWYTNSYLLIKKKY
jgi:hypothetical protein